MNHNINEEKTENPTEHHIKKVRKKGQSKYSKELNSFLILLVGFFNLWYFKDVILFNLSKIIINSFSFNRDMLLKNNIFFEIFTSLEKIFFVLLLFFLSLLIITLIPQIIFSGIQFNTKSLKFDVTKLNPIKGLKKIFSLQIFTEFFKIILKLFLVIIISSWYLWFSFSKILFLIYENYFSALSSGFNIITTCYFLIILCTIPIVCFDIFWKEFNYYKKLKMTRQERKDDSKEQEGNPNIKIRIRREMKAIIRRRMITDIPKADVIITNPIHYSVALQYDEKKMNAPKVIAKGVGEMAIKIKLLAIKHNISIISAPLLARSLYRYSEIGQYIPGALYKAVAEVLAWVWKVRKWKKEGGVFPEKPNNILIPSELNMTGEHKNHD